MQAVRQQPSWLRRIVASLLAFITVASWGVPLLAQTITGRDAGAACCRSNAHACCKRATGHARALTAQPKCGQSCTHLVYAA